MKLPKFFGKKAPQDEEPEDDDDLDDVAVKVVAKASPEDDASDDGDDEEIDEEQEPGARPSRKPLFLIVAAVCVAVVAAGGVWWLAASGWHGLTSSHPYEVVLDIPPRPGQGATGHAGTTGSATDAMNAFAGGAGAGIVVPPVQPTAFAGMTAPKAQSPLATAPDIALVEQSALGPLPKISTDGRKPWQVYARPFPASDKRPRVAVIVGGLGMSREATEGAIRFLPGVITLAFDPYGANLPDWAAKARQAGHEILLGLPMESAGFPAHDPGPYALLTARSPADNLQRLEFLMSRFSGYVGVLTTMGSQFTLDDAQMRPVLDALNKRGLLYVDGMTTPKTVGPADAQRIGLPRGFIDLRIDKTPSRAAIGERLAELEDMARRRGAAIALARPLPVTIERLAAWAASLEGRDVALAPVSATIDRQPLR